MNIQLQQTADNVAAYVVGRGRNDIYHSDEIHTQLVAEEPSRSGGNGSIGRGKNRPCIQPQQEMNHRGVSRNYHSRASSRIYPRFLTQARQQAVKSIRRYPLNIIKMLGSLHSICDTGKYIRSVYHLAVSFPLLGNNFAARHIHKLHYNFGGAVIYRKAVMTAAAVARFNAHHHPTDLTADQGNRYLISAIAAKGIKPPQHSQRNFHGSIAALGKGSLYSLLIACSVILGRRSNFQKYFFAETLH